MSRVAHSESQLPDWFTESGMKERDMACMLLPDLDYDAQLVAIRHLIARHREADDTLASEIKQIDQWAQKCAASQNERAVDEWLELMHASTYQGAAHSMSAVGMLAPLTESIFYSTFQVMRKRLHNSQEGHTAHPRWIVPAEDQWDCHYYWDKGRRTTNLVMGIMQLADAVGMLPHLPTDLKPTLQALFEYRNKMFHCGFEWPIEEREQFQRRMTDAAWPTEWFAMATHDDKPWIFYATDAYVDHCLKTLDAVLTGIGVFCTRVLWPQLPAQVEP